MATNAVLGQGTLLQRGDGASPENFTTVAEMLSIDGPNLASDPVDVSHQQGVNRYRDFIQGLRQAGEVNFECNYIPSNATQNASTGVIADFQNATTRNWRMRFPVTPAVDYVFSAFVRSISVQAPVDSQLKLNVTLQLSGAPTLA